MSDVEQLYNLWETDYNILISFFNCITLFIVTKLQAKSASVLN